MKRFLQYLLVLAVFFIATAPALQAQTTTDNMKVYIKDNGILYRWDAITVDSAGTVWSQTLDLSNYDNYDWTAGVDYGGIAATASGNPKLLLDYWVCTASPDSLDAWSLANDSLATINATTVFNSSTTRLTKKGPYIKFKLTNLATGVAVTALDFGIYFKQRDSN